MLEKLTNLLNTMNDKGFPIPLFRDHGVGSVSFTLVVVSFGNVLYAIDTGKSGDALMYAMMLFTACGSLYFGKKFTVNKAGTIDVDSEDKK